MARLDLGEVEQVVDQADHVLAGSPDVAQVVAVALAADGAELLLQHHLGKADDGVERRADLVADRGQEIRLLGARPLGLAAGPHQLGLGAPRGRDVAQDRGDAARRPARHRRQGEDQRERTVRPPGHDLVAGRRGGPGARPQQGGLGRRAALGREQADQGFARDLPGIGAEEALRAPVHADDAALLVEHHHPVGDGVEDRGRLAQVGVAVGEMDLGRRQRLDRIGVRQAPDREQARGRAVPFDHPDGDPDRYAAAGLRRERDRGALAGAGRGGGIATAEDHGRPAGRRQGLGIVVARQGEEVAVGEQHLVAAMDQQSDRQPLDEAGERRLGAGLGKACEGLRAAERRHRAPDRPAMRRRGRERRGLGALRIAGEARAERPGDLPERRMLVEGEGRGARPFLRREFGRGRGWDGGRRAGDRRRDGRRFRVRGVPMRRCLGARLFDCDPSGRSCAGCGGMTAAADASAGAGEGRVPKPQLIPRCAKGAAIRPANSAMVAPAREAKSGASGSGSGRRGGRAGAGSGWGGETGMG